MNNKTNLIIKKTSYSIAIAFAILFTTFFQLSYSIYAQTENPTTQQEAQNNSAEAEEESLDEENYLAEAGKFHIGGDPTVIILIALFVLAAAVTIDRAIVLKKSQGDNAGLTDLIVDTLKKMPNNVDDLIKKIKKKKYGMEGRVLAKTLSGWENNEESMSEFANAAITAERRNLEKRLVILSTLGNNTPFIGLLGTVLGIMKAFRDLANLGDAGPAVVMKGISEALVATAFGLGVAIPCVIAFNSLNKIVKTRISNVEELVSIVLGMRLAKKSKKK